METGPEVAVALGVAEREPGPRFLGLDLFLVLCSFLSRFFGGMISERTFGDLESGIVYPLGVQISVSCEIADGDAGGRSGRPTARC